MQSRMSSDVAGEHPEATCKKCSRLFTDARILPCLHSFCRECIEGLVKEDGIKRTISCPTCDHASYVPGQGVKVIPRNMRLNYESKIATFTARIKGTAPAVCDACTRLGMAISFCCTCRELLCSPCHEYHQVYKKTLNHKLLIVQETRDRDIAAELMHCIPPDPITCTEHSEAEVEQYCKTCATLVCGKCILIQHNGHSFEGLRSFSDKRKAELREGAQGMAEAMGGIEETIGSCKTMMQRIEVRKISVDEGVKMAFQELHHALHEREQQLLAESTEISMSKTTTLLYQIEELTKMKEELKFCSVTIFDVQKQFNDGHLLSVISVLEGRKHELMRKYQETPMKLREDETISLTLQTAPIVHEISEFGVVGRTSGTYRAIAKPIMTIPGINSPYYVTVHRNGDIFVSSGGDQCIYVFDKNGGKKGKLGSHGTGNGQFNRPYGVVIEGDTILVAENAGNRIQRLTLSGDFITRFGSAGSGPGQLAAPWGVCLGPNNRVYVADCSNQRIQIFNTDGTAHGIITGAGTADSAIPSPTGVSMDQSGNTHVAVAQGEARCIKVFGPDGKFIRKYGMGQVQNPAGIAIDERGYCIVGDWIGKKLCIFSPLGDLVRSIPTPGYLCGVTIDRDGYIYVVDTTNKCIYKY